MTTSIAILTDTHANLPALQVALDAIQRIGCDAIYHTGDAIAIGPHPGECLDLLLNTPDMRCIMGNHDEWFAHGLPDPQPEWMNDGEVAHQHWTHAQLDPAWREEVKAWPYAMEEQFGDLRVVFTHYGLDDTGRNFLPIVRPPSAAALDAMFAGYEADLVFYGHDHIASEIVEQARYANPGSLGCHTEAVARFVTLEINATGSYTLQKHAVPYDDAPLLQAFEQRRVPERTFLYNAFFGGRFKTDD